MWRADPRTLGLLRIGIALLLLVDWLKRALSMQLWYGDDGLLPAALLREHDMRVGHHSLLWLLPSDDWLPVAFAIILAIYLGLLVGYRTKLFQVLALVSLLSLQSRVTGLSNGGDYVFCTLLWWTAFLPLGKRFSFDAVLASRRREPLTVEALERDDVTPVRSLAVGGALLQLALIYFFNAVHKKGDTWLEGEAVHYLLHQERVITGLGQWARSHLPVALGRALTYGVLAVEMLIPLFILSPLNRTLFRRLGIVSILVLHLGISLFANFGVFSAVMCVFSILLLTEDDWDALERWVSKHRRVEAFIDRSVATWMRYIRRLSGPPRDRKPSPKLERASFWLREGGAALLMALMVVQMLHENWAIPDPVRIRRLPPWYGRLLATTRMNQGWFMFAPDAPRGESCLVVDAETETGRRVDPIHELAGRRSEPRLDRVPVHPGFEVYWVSYAYWLPRYRKLHRPLRNWLADYHLRTGKPEDRLVRFDVYDVTQQSPPPGEQGPRGVRARKLFSGP